SSPGTGKQINPNSDGPEFKKSLQPSTDHLAHSQKDDSAIRNSPLRLTACPSGRALTVDTGTASRCAGRQKRGALPSG
ncbi:MAG: hypothetical protein ABGZ24_06880, partial [Fuerstiella sp.]